MNLEKSEELKTIKSKKPNKGPYLLGEALGEGAFAKVRLATQIHIKEKCAIKIVDKRLLEDIKDIQRLKKEIKILKSIRHKNIIQLFDIMESKTNLYFVIEYCKGGELFDYIVKNKRLKEEEACVFFQQIINGVEYLHKQGIIHRDLKPENLLLDYNNNIKISDFGLSTFFSKNNYLQTACGTPSYAPPEMLEGLQYNGEASDIWSCGIILYAMLCGSLPFTESKEEIIVRKIKMHDYSIPQYLSKEAQDILYHILKINPEERFTIEKIKKHPWFNIVKPHLIKGIILNEIKIPVDENILNMVQSFGFDKEECRNLLLKNKFCSLTSIYYLCLKKYVREGGKSISDLESDLYEEYINNPNNCIKQNKEKNELKDNKIENKNNNKNKNGLKTVIKNNIINGNNNINEMKMNENINKNNVNENTINRNKKIIGNKDNNIEKTEKINKINNLKINNINNGNKKKIILNKKEQKFLSAKSNQSPNNQKKQKNISSNKVTKKIVITNNKQLTKTKNNILIQDKKPKIENGKNQQQQMIIKNSNNESKKNNANSTKKNEQSDNYNIIKKKLINKVDINQHKKNSINDKKPPKRYIEDNNNNKSNSLVNSFNKKNKSLEQEIYNNNLKKDEINKINGDKIIKVKDSVKGNNKFLDIHSKEKNIIHSNTITGNKLNNNKIKKNYNNNENNSPIKKGVFALGSNPNSNVALNIFYEQSKAKQAYQNYRNYLREGNGDARNKSSPFPIEQFGIDKDIDESKFIEGQTPLNVINYIAKKLVSISFCGSFNFEKSSAKNYSTSRRGSALTYNHLVSNGNIKFNKESNPINEEIDEYIKENNESGINGSNNKNDIEKKEEKEGKEENINENNDNHNEEEEDKMNENINDINFKNLVNVLNQKFKKYLANNSEIKENENKSNNENINNNFKNKKVHFNIINNQKVKSQSNSNKNNKLLPSESTKFKYSKNIEYEEDLYPNSFNKKYKNDLFMSTNDETYAYNINDMTSHYNKFLDISTNYDPGLDSRGNSSIERSDSINKNELRNFSFSLDKKNKKKGDHKFKTEYNGKNKGNNYNVIKNTFNGSQNKFINNDHIISENEEFSQNTMKIKINKNLKNKYSPFLEKKVSINLSTTFNNISKNEYKQKNNKY